MNNERPDIETSILQLEAQKQMLLEGMQSEIHEVAESLRPANLIKNAATGIMAPSVRITILKYAAGAVLGYVARRYILGGSSGMVKKAGIKVLFWVFRKLIFKI